jgi:hypothetical protein
METISVKCMSIDTVESFCGCIAGEEGVDDTVRDFCDRAKAPGSGFTSKDVAALKSELMEAECCSC